MPVFVNVSLIVLGVAKIFEIFFPLFYRVARVSEREKGTVQIYVVVVRIGWALMCRAGMRKMYLGEETSWLDGVPFIVVCCSRYCRFN
jgi:hypothetical protein